MKRFLHLAAFLFSIALVLPGFQMATGLLPDKPLVGVETGLARPALTPTAWWNGTFQEDIDAWLNQRIGLRGALVRTANQIQSRLFGELASSPGGTRVLPGREGFLFEGVYVDAFNQPGDRPESEIRNISQSVRRVQDYLAADGLAFLLVIAPSKAEIYPEVLPPVADVAGRPGRRSNYQNTIEHLRRDGVNLVDAHAYFREWRAEPDTPLLFSKGGTHWNQYGAARIVEHILEDLRRQTGRDLPAIRVTGAVTNRVIVGEDNDLGELANLWSSRSLAGPQVHPVFEKIPGTDSPDILFVGDSFVFTLTNFMDREDLYRRRDTYYYYNRHYAYPEAPVVELDKRNLDLLETLRGRDAVVIEVNEYFLPRIGFGFVRDLLRAYVALENAVVEDPEE